MTTSNESEYGITYKLEPDAKVLGQKYRKETGAIKKGLLGLSPAQIKEYIDTKTLTLDRITLEDGDLQVFSFVTLDYQVCKHRNNIRAK